MIDIIPITRSFAAVFLPAPFAAALVEELAVAVAEAWRSTVVVPATTLTDVVAVRSCSVLEGALEGVALPSTVMDSNG